jgi:anti-anti-sigma regulatory factor
LIDIASAYYHQGRRGLVLDLRQTSQIELSGLFALLSIARLYNGQPLLDPEAGWVGLHEAAEEVTPALGERVKLVAPSPVAAAALERANFCHFFTHYPDLDTALKTIRV